MLEIAAAYGDHKFGGMPEKAAPCMFTFLRYPGMPPHNNAAELEIRDAVVLHRNVRHQLTNALGREVFSIMVSVARTCHKQGILPRLAVEELIRDPDWDVFRLPDAEQAKLAVVPMAA